MKKHEILFAKFDSRIVCFMLYYEIFIYPSSGILILGNAKKMFSRVESSKYGMVIHE